MPKYQVGLQRTETYVERIDIEAASAEEAEQKAEELLEEGVSFDNELSHGDESVFEIIEQHDDERTKTTPPNKEAKDMYRLVLPANQLPLTAAGLYAGEVFKPTGDKPYVLRNSLEIRNSENVLVTGAEAASGALLLIDYGGGITAIPDTAEVAVKFPSTESLRGLLRQIEDAQYDNV